MSGKQNARDAAVFVFFIGIALEVIFTLSLIYRFIK